jgi:hypothetical protein
VTSELLKELNPDVQGDFIVANVEKFVFEEVEKIKNYQLIIASDITNVIIEVIMHSIGCLGLTKQNL